MYRVFPISHNYYLSKLLFSPDANKPAQRILLAKEVHNAEDYRRAIASFHGRAVPGALLKFTVFDETLHKLPGFIPSRVPSLTQGESTPGLWTPSAGSTQGANSNINVNWTPASLVPPPPVIFSTPPMALGMPSLPSRDSFPCSHGSFSPPIGLSATMCSRESTPTQTQPITQMYTPSLNPFLSFGSGSAQSGVPQHQAQQKQEVNTTSPTPSSCCSASQKKNDIETLLTTFKADLERIMDDTFKATPSASSPAPVVPGAWPEPTPSTHAGILGVPIEASSRGSGTHTCLSMWCMTCGKLFEGPWYSCDKCSWHVLVRISFIVI